MLCTFGDSSGKLAVTDLTRTSFPVPIRREAYVFPTIAIAVAAAAATAVIYVVAGRNFAQELAPGVDQLYVVIAAVGPALAGVIAAGIWIERRQRIHRERKLIIDAHGITYVAMAGREQLMRWDEFRRVDEQQSRGDGACELVYLLAKSTFVVSERDFHGYQQIRRMTRERLPDRTQLLRRK